MKWEPEHLKKRPMLRMLMWVGLLFGLIFTLQIIKKIIMHYALRQYQSTFIAVTTAPVTYQLWQPRLSSYGTLRAIRGVEVTTELAGLVRTIYFTAGAQVKAGEVLVQLNAEADVAALQAIQAQTELARITYERNKAQFAIHAVSQAVLDQDQQNLKNLQAQAAEQQAIVAKKTLVAPFSGRLGVSKINPGQYINAGDPVVTLQAFDPILIDFYIPQQQLTQLRIGAPVQVNTDAVPDQVFTGKVTTINPLVDTQTRNVQIEATLANPQSQLYPGMFAAIEVATGTPQRYLTLPQTAISFNPYGELVYIVQPKNEGTGKKPLFRVLPSFVKTGEKRGEAVMILSGLREGDIVVTSGQLKLKKGTLVTINNRITLPKPSLKSEQFISKIEGLNLPRHMNLQKKILSQREDKN
jgi:membrane fusion protein, multidrug efflux system